MLQFDILGLIPQSLKRQALDTLVDFVSEQARKYASEEIAARIKKLRSDSAFNQAFEEGLKRAIQRFVQEYEIQDEDLVAAIAADEDFFKNEDVRAALLTILKKPGVYLAGERERLAESFDSVLPGRKNRERVDRAVLYLLKCLAEEVWHLPELQPIYSLQFQRMTAEATRQQVELQKAQLQALSSLNAGVREALLQLTDAIAERKLLPPGEAPALPAPPSKPKVYHNLPQPNYGRFVGREQELAQVARILRPYPHSQHALVTIDGIGGIGKSALALEAAHRYLRNYDRIPPAERFEAIIWTSAKQSVLTTEGILPRDQALRTLDDIYTTIAVTLQREDITRTRPEEQAEVVRNALTRQRTLLIVDNLETVDDEAVLTFLRELPAPTKAIVTTRHRVDVAYPVRLVGMPWKDAQVLIGHECDKKGVGLSEDEARHLYDRTGGVPLAIVWSVSQMGVGYGVEMVLRRLGEPTGDIARFCFQEALERIRGESAHKLLVAVSLFATAASREALGYVTNLPELDRDEGLVELERLSLVNREGGQFHALPLTKEYVIQDFESGKSGLDYWNFLTESGPRLVSQSLETGDLKAQAEFALWRVSWMLVKRGEYDKAEGIIRQIESVAAAQDLVQVQAESWTLLGLLYREMKDFTRSLEWFDRADKFYRGSGSPLPLSGVLNRKADALRRLGDYDRAKKCILEALGLLDELSISPHQRLVRKTLLWGDLGFTLSREGNYEEAEKHIDQCVDNLQRLAALEQYDEVMAIAYIEKAVVTYHLRGRDEANLWAGKAEERIHRSKIKRPICDGDEVWLRILETEGVS